MLRRALAVALALAPLASLSFQGPEPAASASVALLMSLDELAAASSYAVLATPVERKSVWEDVGSSHRIVTYTRVEVERVAFGAPKPSIWVRTLGGAVGKIGQSVSGEAQLATGEKALLFLLEVDGVVAVAGRAQGHFPITADGHLKSSPEVGMLVPKRGPTVSAREALLGAAVDDAMVRVAKAKAEHVQ